MKQRIALPVDIILPELVESLKRCPTLVVEAPPGAGKTTRIPPALLPEVAGQIIVLEPRRIAARLAARRVASELGEQLGLTVGYQVRFEEVGGRHTRLRFVTEGVLTRKLISDPELKGVDVVILDEFHERHLESDLALALLKRLQQRRPSLRIIVMSATLDAAPVAHYLNDCPILRSEGQLFEIDIQYRPYSSAALEIQLREAVELLLGEKRQGDILAFLPGAAEIRRAMRECESLARRSNILILPLHGDLPPAEQDRAVAPAAQQKLILATNVAESSVTVEGVNAVIDSGLARFSSHSPWLGLPTLQMGRISKASAKQRAGRAGRTGAGQVLRLYTQEDFRQRPDHDAPEITRTDLSQLCLTVRAMGIEHIQALDWIDIPPEAAISAAEALLDKLGAHGEMAQQLSRYPLPPRLARIVMEGVKKGVGEDICRAVALLSSGVHSTHNDILHAIEVANDSRTQRHFEQLLRIARPPKQQGPNDDAVLFAILAGFPDRVGRRRQGGQVLLSSGTSAEIQGEPSLYEFLVAVDAEDRKDKPFPLIRMMGRIEPEWLLDLFPDHVQEKSTVEWNRNAERVDAVESLVYDNLVIQESRGTLPEPTAAADILVEKALEAGLGRFVDQDALEELLVRIELAGLPEPDLRNNLHQLCLGIRSFQELKNTVGNLIPLLEQQAGMQILNEIAPTRIRLQGGRQTRIHYERNKQPWIASRLQDFFGMHETPRIGAQRIPAVIHLLAPNQRAVQTTTDLAGFWERLYPQVRRELMRRYPKHAWPEKP